MPPESVPCPTCSSRIELEYCATCGERRSHADDLSLRAYALQALEGIASLDGKAWRSVVGLLRPGFLTREYVRGARQRYLRPVGLFVFANVAYFLLHPLTGARTFNTSLAIHRSRLVHSNLARRLVDEELATTGESLTNYAARFDSATDTLSRLLLILLAPGLAATLALLIRKRPFGFHFAFALHFLAFFVFYFSVVVVIGLRYATPALSSGAFDLRAITSENGMTALAVLISALYLTLGLRRAYERRWPAAVAGAIVLVGAFAGSLQLYRALLFFVVFFTD